MEGLLVKDNYTEKSFVVYGETKKYKDSLKNLGGKFNKNLKIGEDTVPGWVFGKKNLETVMEFVQKANSGEVVALSSELPSSPSTSLPTVTVPSSSSNYQFVKFKIYKPSEGQRVKLKVDGKVVEGKVIKTETHNDIVDTVYIDFDGRTSAAVIINGVWAINGYAPRHFLFFEN
jgi:hypothetical protein